MTDVLTHGCANHDTEGKRFEFPHPLLRHNVASILDQWRTMYFPLALFAYPVCCQCTEQCFSVLRTHKSDVVDGSSGRCYVTDQWHNVPLLRARVLTTTPKSAFYFSVFGLATFSLLASNLRYCQPVHYFWNGSCISPMSSMLLYYLQENTPSIRRNCHIWLLLWYSHYIKLRTESARQWDNQGNNLLRIGSHRRVQRRMLPTCTSPAPEETFLG